ncbi:MAG TPA: Na+/H+ antiporter NhaA [Candidatus Dormibacteraeota bacterium]|nr:Na+/H+ antiporter NhaA [Candidatus Dormibacteraeota bacterium]
MAVQDESARTGLTAWTRARELPLGRLLSAETTGAALLVAATLVALVWTNVDEASYEGLWGTRLTIAIGGWGVSQELRLWVNNGLMTLFFFVVGMEARRELDIGELRRRSRLALPVLAGVAGMAAAVAVYLALNQGRPSARGWGVAMSTDTAFALGLLAVVGPPYRERLRAFLVTVLVVDDLVALAAITLAYSGPASPAPVVVAAALLAGVFLMVRLGIRQAALAVALGVGAWLALLQSGVDPLVVGLVMGLMTYAYPAGRSALERATDLFRSFREQPTPELARSAQSALRRAVSPNERLRNAVGPWTSFAIVPVFALANAGIVIDWGLLRRAPTSPVFLGIVLGYVVGKPVGIACVSYLATKLSRGRVRPPVGWGSVAGGGTISGVGFTVALLIASLAFRGERLAEAKLGVLTAVVLAAAITWGLFRIVVRLPHALKVRALFGIADPIVDLVVEVDAERDHVRGPEDAPVTLVEYGDFECPYCGRAEPAVRELLAEFGDDVRYVWRHLPLTDVHPHAQLAAEAAEAAGAQDAFWPMHDVLLARQDALRAADLVGHARELGLDVERFGEDLRGHAGAGRVAEDVDGADLSGVSGTPTFFVNGRRHYGAFDLDALTTAVRLARAQPVVRRRD